MFSIPEKGNGSFQTGAMSQIRLPLATLNGESTGISENIVSQNNEKEEIQQHVHCEEHRDASAEARPRSDHRILGGNEQGWTRACGESDPEKLDPRFALQPPVGLGRAGRNTEDWRLGSSSRRQLPVQADRLKGAYFNLFMLICTNVLIRKMCMHLANSIKKLGQSSET